MIINATLNLNDDDVNSYALFNWYTETFDTDWNLLESKENFVTRLIKETLLNTVWSVFVRIASNKREQEFNAYIPTIISAVAEKLTIE